MTFFVQQTPLAANRVLAALPEATLESLRPHFTRVEMLPKRALLRSGENVDHVYFPLRGMVSLLRPLEDGTVIEVGMVGPEGAVGLPSELGTGRASCESVVRISGIALRLPAEALLQETARSPAARDAVLRFVQALFAQLAQSAACNARHSVQQRLARWLLMAHDRVGDVDLQLSHELLGSLLARRRAGVTVAAGNLKAGGLIFNRHGRIGVRDRAGLEAQACECYRVIASEYDRLMPPAAADAPVRSDSTRPHAPF